MPRGPRRDSAARWLPKPYVMATDRIPVILAAGRRASALTASLEPKKYSTVALVTGTMAVEWAPDVQPDAIVVDADLPDMSGIEVCRLLHADLRVGLSVPIFIVEWDKPTPEQRVAALQAGAWDFLRFPAENGGLSMTLDSCLQAKRNLDGAVAVGDGTGLLGRSGLARRARQLGALMARRHGALACVVFALESPDPQAGALLASLARVSDVVGMLTAAELAVLAPATNEAGAVTMAARMSKALGTRQVGFTAVENLGYFPTDPVALLARASAAVRGGEPAAAYPWVRFLGPATEGPRSSGPTGAVHQAAVEPIEEGTT